MIKRIGESEETGGPPTPTVVAEELESMGLKLATAPKMLIPMGLLAARGERLSTEAQCDANCFEN